MVAIPTRIPWVSVCLNWKNHVVLLECSVLPHGSRFITLLSGDLSLIIGLEAKRVVGVGPEENKQGLASQLTHGRPL